MSGIFVEGHDVTARVIAEQRQKLMVEEVHHRLKNTLAIVQSIAMLSGKTATSIEEYKTIFSARIVAMERTQSFAIQASTGTISVREIIEAELAPYLDQVKLLCDYIEIDFVVGGEPEPAHP